VVMGDVQYLPGYCLLLPDPVMPDLNSLDGERRIRFLEDMALIGDALLEVTDAYRINYEILGNTEPALHAHIFPRYMTEPEEWRKKPVWARECTITSLNRFNSDRDKQLMQRIAEAVRQRL
jgi:diadenosine tetraphosphate (Ap4A) HIT family hydrolase